MPQFDIFSFFSQLFWVFFGFAFLYFTFSFVLLPALASTLKVRKAMLLTNSTNSAAVTSIDPLAHLFEDVSAISNVWTKHLTHFSKPLELAFITNSTGTLTSKSFYIFEAFFKANTEANFEKSFFIFQVQRILTTAGLKNVKA